MALPGLPARNMRCLFGFCCSGFPSHSVLSACVWESIGGYGTARARGRRVTTAGGGRTMSGRTGDRHRPATPRGIAPHDCLEPGHPLVGVRAALYHDALDEPDLAEVHGHPLPIGRLPSAPSLVPRGHPTALWGGGAEEPRPTSTYTPVWARASLNICHTTCRGRGRRARPPPPLRGRRARRETAARRPRLGGALRRRAPWPRATRRSLPPHRPTLPTVGRPKSAEIGPATTKPGPSSTEIHTDSTASARFLQC